MLSATPPSLILIPTSSLPSMGLGITQLPNSVVWLITILADVMSSLGTTAIRSPTCKPPNTCSLSLAFEMSSISVSPVSVSICNIFIEVASPQIPYSVESMLIFAESPLSKGTFCVLLPQLPIVSTAAATKRMIPIFFISQFSILNSKFSIRLASFHNASISSKVISVSGRPTLMLCCSM